MKSRSAPRVRQDGVAESGGQTAGENVPLHSLTMPVDPLARFKVASQAQREEIVKHQERLVQCYGRAVSLDEAARDWIVSHAAEWRERFEAGWPEPAKA